MLNENLIKLQKLSVSDVQELERLHDQRERMFDTMKKLDPTDSEQKATLILLSELLESLEYNMQRKWKFEQDSKFHSWWYQVPHCSCPKLDNADPIYPGRIINQSCPIHGRDQ